MTDQDLFHAQQRIAVLEQVSDLYERIGKEEPQFGSADEGTGGGGALNAADQDPEIIKLVQEGNEIHAIKRYRELTGLGLAEATDAIRVLNRQYGPIDQYRG